MKAKFSMIIIVFLLSIPAALSPTARAASAENGEWIEYPFSYPSSGTVYIVYGEDCIGVTTELRDSILFFDINKSAWTELKFDGLQRIRDVKAEAKGGHTVFAYTDEFLVGYSSFTCSYDVIRYNGSLLSSYSYGCGKNLAFFVTNETMYVFDSELGRWQEYDYGLPADYKGSSCMVWDDYVLVVLHRSLTWGEKTPKNVVYSLHKHSFNQLENGCSLPNYPLDHGSAGYYPINWETREYILVGYSAYTNEFNVIQVSYPNCSSSTMAVRSDEYLGERTVYTISFGQNLEPSGERGYFYGYDTRLGSWSSITVNFPIEERWSESWMPGGQFSVDSAILPDERYKLIIYSGITGQWSIEETSLIWGSVSCVCWAGGEVFVACDVDNAWVHSFTTEQSSMISLDYTSTIIYPNGGGRLLHSL